MKETKTGAWIAGTVVVSLLLGVAGWFLAISPALASASEKRLEAEAQVAQNDVARARINQLKAQFEQMDSLTAQLGTLRGQLPTDAQLAEFKRQVAATAAVHAVTVIAVQTSTPAPVAAPAPAAPVADTADPAAAPAEPAADPAAAQPAAAPDASLYAVPVTIDVLGGYANVLAFLSDLQQAQPRLLAVESITNASQQAAEPSGGKPATAAGDLGMVVTGYLFALPAPAAAPGAEPTADATPAPAAPLPVPDPAKNPMVPLG